MSKTKKRNSGSLRLLTIDDLYITPFTLRKAYDEELNPVWLPLERNLHPTGLQPIDAVLQLFSRGVTEYEEIARRLGCRATDVTGAPAC